MKDIDFTFKPIRRDILSFKPIRRDILRRDILAFKSV